MCDRLRSRPVPRVSAPPLRVVINGVRPSTPDRVSAAKAVAGRPVLVSANVFADGHDVIAARVRFRRADGGRSGRVRAWIDTPMVALGNDRFEALVVPERVGGHELVIEGWVDAAGTWRHLVEAKLHAGQDVGQELEEGARLIEGQLDRLPAALAAEAAAAVLRLRDVTLSAADRAAPALGEPLAGFLSGLPDRMLTTTSGPWAIWADRERAAVGSWYELFPRSYGGLAGAADRLTYVADLGFDVVYLPPVHPIGTTARKGPGNTVSARPGDPGSPWAIGSAAGGHDAIAPELGTMADFDAFVAEAGRLGLDVALDYALQCSPDHPWVGEHPEWFSHRPDGSIRFAENPPKQYQDIYPLNFYPEHEKDRVALWKACRDLILLWVGHGIAIFRVDNPHTKPFAFWSWLIDEIHQSHPEVVFLAEAFTRPALMHRLAEIGFSQSYTYFTWRTTKAELTDYAEELAHGPDADYFRPNLWPNTPDILSGPLRQGPPAAFRERAVLAATLGPSWGIYSGYELCENQPASDTNEEYAASEKYEIKVRRWDEPGFDRRADPPAQRHPAPSSRPGRPLQPAFSPHVEPGSGGVLQAGVPR